MRDIDECQWCKFGELKADQTSKWVNIRLKKKTKIENSFYPNSMIVATRWCDSWTLSPWSHGRNNTWHNDDALYPLNRITFVHLACSTLSTITASMVIVRRIVVGCDSLFSCVLMFTSRTWHILLLLLTTEHNT